MKVSDRLDLVDRIGRELQHRYRYDEIDSYLNAFSIEPPKEVTVNSKWVYSKKALERVPLEIVLKIADDLEVSSVGTSRMHKSLPRNWEDVDQFKLFVSHISKDKDKATRLRDALSEFQICAFVAHEDIHPSLEWQSEIQRALNNMDAMVSIHTKDFSKSNWTQQEIGYALGRGVKIISIRMGEDPTGFISRWQAISRGRKKAEQIAEEINRILLEDEITSIRLKEVQEASSNSWNLDDDEIPF